MLIAHKRQKIKYKNKVNGTSILTKERINLVLSALNRNTEGKTMIFANTARSVQELAKLLKESGVNCVEYHKLLPSGERHDNLSSFRMGNVMVLVCTDHASRGLDIANVSHVVQAEFALNVTHYLHRVGRASRAGVDGQATSFYDESSAELVRSILSGGGSVEQSFSRNRGFRAKLKKIAKQTAGKVRNRS